MEGAPVSLKTYQAYSMAEALAAVKRDLGPSAVILSTRSFKRGGILGVGRRTVIEVTATVEAAPAERSAPTARRSNVPAAVRAYAARTTSAGDGADAGPAGMSDDGPDATDRLKTRRLAQAMLEQAERKRATAPEPAPPAASTPPPLFEPPPEPASRPAPPRAPSLVPTPPARPLPVARRFILTPTDATPAAPASGTVTLTAAAASEVPAGASAPAAAPAAKPAPDRPPAPDPAPAPDAAPAIGPDAHVVQDELAAIRQMVGEVLQRQVRRQGTPTPSMPERLFDLYLKMLGQDLSEELADRVVNEVRDELSSAQLEDAGAVRDAVRRALALYIPTADEPVSPESPDGRPLTIALVGPTGVGKTTTVAKLAASFKLRGRRRVGLVTADTYRIAAVDQLRTYANIIGLPLKVVLTPGEMRQAVHALSDCDVILIDTAGRSQNDTGRLEELKAFIDGADPHEVHLVLSSTAGEKVLMREAEAFGSVGIDKVVLTKLDEAVSFGVLVNVIRRIGKTLSFFTTGQEVPDHLEAGQPERLAELVLGSDLSDGAGRPALGPEPAPEPDEEPQPEAQPEPQPEPQPEMAWAEREAVTA
jgi:flagellar biosynthesis protein FlhF